MTISPEFLDCMNQEISSAEPLANKGDGSAECTYGTPVRQKVRKETQNKIVVSANGVEQRSNTLLIAENAITEQARVWLTSTDDGDNTLARLPMAVEIGVDEDGTPHHYEVSI